ncbi:MAG: GNAT family N-acetyltransferase [Fibrobacterota bacterium]
MEVKFKDADYLDTDAIQRYYHSLYREHLPYILYKPKPRPRAESEYIRLHKTAGGRFLLAYSEDVMIAALSLLPYTHSQLEHSASLSISVAQKFRGQGLGYTMLTKILHWAAEKKLYRIELSVLEHNERARRLYEKCGFKKEGIKRDAVWVDDRYYNVILMAQLLK